MEKKKRSDAAQRAWNLLRLALLWARKGGVFKRRLMMELRLVPKFLKGLGRAGPRTYFSPPSRFDEILLPCISAEEVDFAYDNGRTSCSTGSESTEVEEVEECDENENSTLYPYSSEIEDEGIDSKAEKFIAKFYEQIRLQRQISYLEYAERGSKS